jgi:hypothetical protein
MIRKANNRTGLQMIVNMPMRAKREQSIDPE